MIVTIEQTVVKLFRMLEAQAIRYAVLRNYELFPSLHRAGDLSPHTDIDLVVDSRDLDLLRGILSTIAAEDAWDGLSECGHWARSDARHHHIQVFRFHRARPLEYLQVDVFHSYLLWGLPVFDERQMLEDSVYDPELGLRRIDPLKENVYRLVQIHGLYPGSERKRLRYQQRILAFRSSNCQSLDLKLASVFGRFGLNALDALGADDVPGFLRNMRLARLRFTLIFALHHPLETSLDLLYRLRENIGRFYTRQCGLVLRVAVRDEAQRQAVRDLMDELVRNSFMDEWREYAFRKRPSLSDHFAMEQGAVIIEWSKRYVRDAACLDLRTAHEPAAIVDAILRACASRHQILYARKSAQVPARMEASVR